MVPAHRMKRRCGKTITDITLRKLFRSTSGDETAATTHGIAVGVSRLGSGVLHYS